MLHSILIMIIIIAIIIGNIIVVKLFLKNKNLINIRNSKILIGVGFAILLVVVIIIGVTSGFKEKIDVKGSTMIEYLSILERYGQDIDFNGIESGANCYTGTQTKTIDTKKYGKVTVDFSYCKASKSVYIHVFN